MSMSPLTASFPTLPLDVVELVAENLSLDKELAALKSCSLACHAFLDICRKHIFCTLCLDNSTVHRIGALQRRSRGSPAREPPLAVTNYVRNLVYITEEPTDRKHRGGPSILKYFSRVRSFTLVVNDCYSSTTQKGLPSSLKTSLSHFTRANHLVHLRLFGIKNLPATFFLQLPYLSKLSMEHSTVAEVPYVRKAEVKPLKLVSFSSHNGRIMPLLNARTANGTSILDLTGLEEFAMGVDDIATNDGMDLVKGFLETSTQLKSLTLSGLYPKLVPGLGKLAGVLTADNLKTLRILKFYPMLETCDIDPYLYLVHELEIISAKNVLQELILEIDVETDCCCTTDHDAWSKLDRVLSQKGAFPFMRRVRILITLTEYSFDYRDFIEELQEVGRVCFPWLWQSKDVEFTFKVQTEEI